MKIGPEGKLGVLLIQLGGPQKREDLKPFLYELFADPEIIGIPFAPARKAVAWFIATTRASKSAETYEKIGWSPIRCWTEKQAMLLEERLAKDGLAAIVRPSMTCSRPFVREALTELKNAGVTRLLVLPLYPQYSVTTTRSSFSKVTEDLAHLRWKPERLDAPGSWYEDPSFIAAHVATIEAAARTLPDQDPSKTVLLYSAHSLPVATVEKQKDPYPEHIEATAAAIDAALGNRYRSRLAYQSKVGPMAWLGPATQNVIAELAAEGVKQVVVAPIAFVSDHVETLYEISMLFADDARARGITHFVPAAGLNDSPLFIDALRNVVAETLARVSKQAAAL